MAFKLTYTDGQESDYDDDTKWALEDGGVLKLGRGEDNWSVLVSPGHWATIELGKGGAKKKDDEAASDEKDDNDEKADKTDKTEKAEKDKHDKDDDEDDDDS